MSPSFFFRVPEKTPRTVWRCQPVVLATSLRSTQHRNNRVLLRPALRVRLWLGVRQQLDRRPQLIDQRLAVANFPPPFDTGQSIPQRQKLLTAEPGCMQFLV